MNDRLIEILATSIYEAHPYVDWEDEAIGWSDIAERSREYYRKDARRTLATFEVEGFKVVQA